MTEPSPAAGSTPWERLRLGAILAVMAVNLAFIIAVVWQLSGDQLAGRQAMALRSERQQAIHDLLQPDPQAATRDGTSRSTDLPTNCEGLRADLEARQGAEAYEPGLRAQILEATGCEAPAP